MIKRKLFAVIDTETAGNGWDSQVPYEIGMTIAGKNGEIEFEQRWLVKEIITNKEYTTPRTMYFYQKLDDYRKMYIENPEILQTANAILWEMNYILQKLEIDVLAGYNFNFDLGALERLAKQFTPKSKWFQDDYQLLDIYLFAVTTIGQHKTFTEMANKYNWKTAKGNISTNAETMFKYVTMNSQFVEEHTALEDARIETQIMANCFRQKKKVPYNDIRNSVNIWNLVPANMGKNRR